MSDRHGFNIRPIITAKEPELLSMIVELQPDSSVPTTQVANSAALPYPSASLQATRNPRPSLPYIKCYVQFRFHCADYSRCRSGDNFQTAKPYPLVYQFFVRCSVSTESQACAHYFCWR
jgi:hypothetical protein